MSQVRSDLTGVHTGISQSLRNVGRDMTYALTVPLAAIGAASVKLASDFDAALRNIASISPDFAANFDEMGQKILEFGSRTRSGAQAAAEAFYQITSAGILDANDAFAIMEQSVFTAEAGLADLTATTKGLTSALLAFDAASDPAFANMSEAAEHYGNVLTRAVQLGVGSMNEFVPALGRAAASAAMAGSSYEQLASAAAFLTQRGITVYNAGTAMNNVFNKLISPTDRLRQAFTQLGVTTSKELFEKFGDLQGVLRALEGVFGDSAEAWGEAFNSIQAKRAIFGIMNNFEDFEQFMKDFNNGLDTATKTAWLEQMKSFEGQVGLMSSAIKGLATQIGQVLLPILLPLIGNITAFFQQAMKLNPEILKLIIGFAALAAAVGPLVWLIGTLLSPMGILIGLVGGLGIALSTNLGGIGDTIKNAVSTAVPSLGRLAEAVQGFIDVVAGPGNSAYAFNDYFQGQMEMLGANFGGGGPGKSTAFHVNPGDTLSGLAGSTGLTIEQMMQAANITDPKLLMPGDYIFTEAGTANPNAGLRPTTRQSGFGDRLAQAWQLFGQQIIDAISGAIGEVLSWIKTDGATLAGRLVGELSIAILNAVKALFGIGVDAAGSGVNFISEFSANFSKGFASALEEADISEASFEGFAIKLIGLMVTAIVGFEFLNFATFGLAGFGLNFAVNVIKAAFGMPAGAGAAELAPGLGQTIASYVGGVLKVVLGGITGAMILGVVSGVGIYSAMADETRDGIAKAILDAIGVSFVGINGQDAELEVWRQNAQIGIANGLAGIFEAAGRSDIAEALRQLARDTAAEQTEIFKSEYRLEVENLLLGGNDITSPWYVAPELEALNNVNPNALQGISPLLPSMPGPTLPPDWTPQSSQNEATGRALGRFISMWTPFVTTIKEGLLEAIRREAVQARTDAENELYNWIADPTQFMEGDPIKGGGAGKRSGGGAGSSFLKPAMDQMILDVDNGVEQLGLSFSVLPTAIAASIPLVAVALAGFNLTVLIGMSALLLTVTTFADLIIGKWNEMLMTLGSAPVNVGYTPGGMYGGNGGNTTVTTNVFVKTDNPNKINESLKKQNVNLYSGKIERTEI